MLAALHDARASDSTDPGSPRAYTTSASLWSLEFPPTDQNASIDSYTPEVLAYHGWYLPVGLLVLLPPHWDIT